MFLARHPGATVFHSVGWLDALRLTYGYRPVVVTSTPGGADLVDALVFCSVDSWLTGTRIVSLPFSDHCEPLVDSEARLACLIQIMKDCSNGARYFEIRPIAVAGIGSMGLEVCSSFCLHRLDLRPPVDDIFRKLHKSCIQRKIRRAERESLRYESGTSDSILDRFYRLLVLTRRRQQLLPQPLEWFRNLIACMGDRLQIRLASKAGLATAGILTIRCKDTLVYKYGCSARPLSGSGGTQFLLWMAILDAKNSGLSQFDMGRSDWDNHGLLAFKDRWGADRQVMRYWRYSVGPSQPTWPIQFANCMLRYIPDGLRPMAARIMYRHYA
jgi:hypothetical protein